MNPLNKITRVAFLLFVASHVAAQQQPLSLSMRRMYVATAETQEASAMLDDIFTRTSSRLSANEQFDYIPVQQLQEHTGGTVLDDFDMRLEPNALLHIKKSETVDVLLFFYIEQIEKEYRCRLTAKEFPSGVLIAEITFPLDVKKNNSGSAQSVIEDFVQDVKKQRSDFGYPFHSDEKGVLIITDSYENSAFRQSLTGLWKAKKRVNNASGQRLAMKSVFYYFDGDSNYVDVANALLKASHAQAVLIQSEHRDEQIVVVPPEQVNVSVLENELPLWPPYDGFSFFVFRADSLWAEDYGCSFFPQTSSIIPQLKKYSGRKSQAAALLFSNTIRTLEDSLYSGEVIRDAELLDDMSGLYPDCINAYDAYKPETGWIALNYGQFLFYAQKYAEALERLDQSLQIFDSFSNQFGPLFVNVLCGNIYQKTANPDKAAESFQQAVKLADALNDGPTLAWLYFQLGALSLELDRSLEAWNYFGFSAERYLSLGQTETVVTLYTKIGVLLRQNTLLLKSREYLQQALELAETREDDRLIADAAYHLAATEEELGERETALTLFEQAGDLMEILDDSLYMASVEEHIGDILYSQEKWRASQAGFEYAARFYMYIQDDDGVIRCLVKSADASIQRQKWQRAQSALDEALRLAHRQTGQEWSAIILQKKGLAHIKAGDLAAGEKELELAKSSSLSKEDVDRYMKSLTRELEAELYNLRQDRR